MASSSSSGHSQSRTVALVLGSAAAATVVGGFIYYYYSRKNETQKVSSSTSRKSAKSGGTKDTKKAAEQKPATVGPLSKAVELKDKGNECFRAGKFDDASKHYSQAIESCANIASPAELAAFYQNRAAAQEKLNNMSNVIDDCTKALEGNKRYVKAVLRRGNAYLAVEKYKEALHDFTAACILEQFREFNTMACAEKALKALSVERAKQAMAERSSNRAPLSKSFVDSYLVAFAEDPILNELASSPSTGGGGDNKEINVVNGNATGTDGDNSTSGFEKAKFYLKNKMYDDVIDACAEEIANNGDHRNEATLLRATFALIMGDSEHALKDLDALLDVLNDMPADDNRVKKLKANAYIKRASLFMQQNKKDESFADFKSAQDVDPDNADVYHHRGQVLALISDFAEAMRDFDIAVKLRPDFALCLAQRCFSKYRYAMTTKDSAAMLQAMTEFQNIIDKHPDCAEAYALYGQALTEHDDYDEAVRMFDKAAKLAPTNANIFVHKALLEVQSKNGDIDSSVKMINKALEIDPYCEFAYEALGTTELQRGNIDRALEIYEKAISCARSEMEMAHLFSLYEAADAQREVAKALGVPLSNMFSGFA